MPKMKRNTLLILIVFVCIITSIATYVIMQIVNIESVRTIPMDVRVEKSYGFNVDTDAVHFGSLPPGAGGTRIFSINGDNRQHTVEIISSGDIGQWVSISPREFNLAADETINVSVSVSVPRDASQGLHTGSLSIRMKRFWR